MQTQRAGEVIKIHLWLSTTDFPIFDIVLKMTNYFVNFDKELFLSLQKYYFRERGLKIFHVRFFIRINMAVIQLGKKQKLLKTY